MPQLIKEFDPSAASSGNFTTQALPFGQGYLVFYNESNWTLNVTFPDGSSDIAPAWTASLFHLTKANGNVSWAQSLQANSNMPPISNVWVVAYQESETIPGTFPAPLFRQAIVSGGMGNPVYSVTVGWGSTTDARQKLNVYNPVNSGVTMTFHSARVFDSNTNNPTANLCLISGADLNLANAATITSHIGSSNPPVSVGHATWEDTGIAPIPGTILEVLDVPTSITEDFLAYPDTVTLLPGNNLLIDLAQAGTGLVVRLTLKWSEGPLSVPTQVVNMATQTAATLVNDGNAIGTGIIESTPTGVAQTTRVTNDGLWTLGVDQSGVVHQFLKTQASGNPLLLGQAGDTTEVLGQLTTDQNLVANGGMNINTIRDDVNGNTAMDLSAGDGTVAFNQIIKPNAAGTVHNGSVSGTATLYTPIWGTALKVIILVFSNYQSASTFLFTLPGTISFANLLSGNFGAETVTPQLSGVASNGSAITALASGGGTFAGVGSIAKGIVGELAGATNQLLISSNAGAVSRMLLIIGV